MRAASFDLDIENVEGRHHRAGWRTVPSGAKLVRYHVWIAAVAVSIACGFGKAAAHDVEAVAPGASGVLTKCRGWLVATSCNTYHHIALPSRIAVGDTIRLRFGSSPKDYTFPVARIDLKRQHCAIFSQAEGNRHRVDKINVALCYPADQRR
jgi:hypothetical protein